MTALNIGLNHWALGSGAVHAGSGSLRQSRVNAAVPGPADACTLKLTPAAGLLIDGDRNTMCHTENAARGDPAPTLHVAYDCPGGNTTLSKVSWAAAARCLPAFLSALASGWWWR